VTLCVTAADQGNIGGALLVEDGDADDDGDVVVSLRADVVACGARSASIDVVSVNGVDAGADDVVLAGDVVVLTADVEVCDGAPIDHTDWQLVERPASSSSTLDATDDRAVVTVDAPGRYRLAAVLTDVAGVVAGAPEVTLVVRPKTTFSFHAAGARLHVARGGLDWCSDDDCFAGHCDVGWGARGEVPDVDEDAFALEDPADGSYTAAAVVDEEGAVTLKGFIDGQLDLEVTRQLRPGEPRLVARVVVDGGVASSLEIDDTSPQPGACF
jgi:hypothetical protein